VSWYVQNLLKNKLALRTDSDFESDQYNDLLVIEKKINELYNLGLISDAEINLIEYISDGKPLVDSMNGLGKNRISSARDVSKLCNKIAFFAGGYFTDDGYIDEMRRKYKLTDEEVNKMSQYMRSKFKHKLRRKTKKSNEQN
jgi:hypothetical protein